MPKTGRFHSRIDRLRLMANRGLNTPDYVENPFKTHGTSTAIFLKAEFRDYPHVTILAKKGKQVTEMDEEQINSAFLVTVRLEHDGFLVWILEGVPCEWWGSIRLTRKGSGSIKYRGLYKDKYNFLDFEQINDVKEKSIVRRVHSFMRDTDYEAVQVDFGWAEQFCGKKNERVIFFDFLPLEKFT